MRISLRQKIIFVNLSLLIIVTIAASLITTYELERFYETRIFDQLRTETDEIEYFLTTLGLPLHLSTQDYLTLKHFANSAKIRLTLLDSLGWPLFDSHVSGDSLAFVENHLERPEVQEALKTGIGSHERRSATVGVRMFYISKKRIFRPSEKAGLLSQTQFIRIAIPIAEVERVLQEIRWKTFAGGGVALLLIAVISLYWSKKLTDPIRDLARVAEKVKQGNLDAHFEHRSDDDIGELADLLNEMVGTLRDDVKEMQKLQAMRSQFLGNVSHELRTPIFALQGYLETFLHNSTMDKKRERTFVEKAYQNSIRLNNLLTDLIDISRIESGEMKMSFRRIHVHDWLAKLAAEYAAKDGQKNVAISFDNIKAASDATVQGDKERLTQVLANLVQNAINYNKEGGTVKIGYEEIKNGVRIYVSDSGHGINEEHVSRIFERFYRVDKERSRFVGGTGLGLAIVKHIIEAHRSRVNVESKVGEGTTFSFVLQKK